MENKLTIEELLLQECKALKNSMGTITTTLFLQNLKIPSCETFIGITQYKVKPSALKSHLAASTFLYKGKILNA